jgi:hypothetical protein
MKQGTLGAAKPLRGVASFRFQVASEVRPLRKLLHLYPQTPSTFFHPILQRFFFGEALV